ncbi:MAG: protein kinase [Bacteroidota bacterium]|nr:protein kinase [Bacteroidota bacterium]
MIERTISHFKIIEKLGEGGMGVVYKAQDTRLDRIVALKFLPHYINDDENGKQRFIQEAKAASAINHPNVCVVYDIEEADGEQFIAMEYVDGVTLREKYHNANISINETIAYAIQIGNALQEAHKKGVIHRDVKPDNIMVNGNDQIKIMDFGLAKLKNSILQTRKSTTVGTLAYMSPEQIEGNEIDHRADIFAFGIVFYEMLTQHLPFRGDHEASITYSILHEDFQPLSKYLPDAPSDIIHIIKRALEKEINERYQSISELTNDLRRVQHQSQVTSSFNTVSSEQKNNKFNAEKLFFNLKPESIWMLFAGIGAIAFMIVLFIVLNKPERSLPNTAKVLKNVVQDTSIVSEGTSKLIGKVSTNGTNENPKKIITEKNNIPLANKIQDREKTVLPIAVEMQRKNTTDENYNNPNQSALTEPVQDHYRIAVLPFSNISPNAEDEYFADGMTEELISTLSRIQDLRVIARTSIMQYKGVKKSIVEIARELNVKAVIEGSVRKAGNKLRITVQLIDAISQEHLWSEDYDRDLTDIFMIQADVAQKVAEATQVQLQTNEKQQIGKSGTANSEAYTLYLQGRFYFNKRTPPDLLQSLKYFKSAAQKDQQYALAYAGIADVYTILANYYILPPAETYIKAKEAALKALELDETLGEAHASLAFVLMHFDWDWKNAEKEFIRAIELKPSYVFAQSWYAYFLTVSGRFNEAVILRKRVQKLDPFSVILSAEIGLTLYFTRSYDETIEQYQATLKLDPSFYAAYIPLGAALLHSQRIDEAIVAFKKGKIFSLNHPIASAALAYGYAVTGKKEEALKIVNELKKMSMKSFVSPYWIGIIYVGLGDQNAAFEWFEKGIKVHDGSMILLKVEPILDSIRSDARFTNLLAKVGLNN